MECCGNTIKDLYGFSCPLKCSTYILQSVLFKNPPRHHFIQDEVVLESKFRLAGMGKDVDLIESRRIHRLHLKAAQITSHGNDQPGRRLKGIGAIQRTTVLVIAPLGLFKPQV